MTSNAGAENIISPKRLGFASAEDEGQQYKFMKDRVMEEVKRLFKPEFLNRIDEIMVFHSLTRENMKQIINIMLQGIIRRTKSQMNIELSVNEEAKELLVEKGYDQKYGARPLRRTIQSRLEDKLAQEILDGSVKNGDKIEVIKEGDDLKFLSPELINN